MSTKINVQCELRDNAILKDTLKQMGIDFSAKSQDVITIQRAYAPIMINTSTGELSYDSAATREIESITKRYAANFLKDQCLREGNHVEEEIDSNGDIRIHIL